MQLKLVGVYLDESQYKYILAVKNTLLQENFNFEFEYHDSKSEFAIHFGIAKYPTICLVKNNKIAERIEGKIEINMLRDLLLQNRYVTLNASTSKK